MSSVGVLKGISLSFDEAQRRVLEMNVVTEYALEGVRVVLGVLPEIGGSVLLLPAFGDALLLNPFEIHADRV